MDESSVVTLFLCGDVMTGRGVDQILPHPGDPQIHESYLHNAKDYVALAEARNGLIRKPVSFDYVWGEALVELEHRRPHARIVNLETAVTVSNVWEDKGINYRMHPENIPILKAAKVDVCVLANNHLLDWGLPGLRETLETLKKARIKTAGVGRDFAEASAPAIVDLSPSSRILVFSWATESSGVPRSWAAGRNRPGVNLLEDFSVESLEKVKSILRKYKKPGDLTIFSIHWGGNWGYAIPPQHTQFAKLLVAEAGVDIVHGHSSHHFLGVEVYLGKLIIYGCGDFLTDYEGIRGHEKYRGDLPVMFFPTVHVATGKLEELSLVPLRLKNMRLQRPNAEELQWVHQILNREGKRFGVRFESAGSRSFIATSQMRSVLACRPG